MRLHVINLPHTQTTKAFGQCAYTQKVRKFCNMMKPLGYEITLYASEENEAACDELVTCITKNQQNYFLEEYDWWPDEYYKIPYKDDFKLWEIFNNKAIMELKKRVKRGDVVCVTAGASHSAITKNFPYNTVEWAVGYEGIFSSFRIFESYAWMHHVYGLKGNKKGEPYDEVIPNFFEVKDFPIRIKEDFLLFMSRPVKGKGIEVAKKVADRTGLRLVVAGGTKVEGKNIDWVGYADAKKRGDLMASAKALLAPTLAIEPFGGVAVEAQLCGTPVITTDWGAFTETVEQGVTGFRCRTNDQFVEAVGKVDKLDPIYIGERARELYSTETASKKFDEYFQRFKPVADKAPLFK